ncbi:MAG: hypothetical protein WA825_05220 [Steroidobacteraceae bacterium]
MTAIFVYADSDIAFVASDTKREQLGYQTVANKTVRWSENIVISQTGFGEGLQRLTGEMMSWQHRDPRMLTGAGIAHAFRQVAATRRTDEIGRLQHGIAGAVAGTLVVVEAPRDGTPGVIFTLDWVTEAQTMQPGPVYADGTDQPAFLAIAQTQFKSLGSGGTGFDLANWGLSCIAESKKHPKSGVAVDWPADLTICRLDQGVPVTLVQRVAAPPAMTHPLFKI